MKSKKLNLSVISLCFTVIAATTFYLAEPPRAQAAVGSLGVCSDPDVLSPVRPKPAVKPNSPARRGGVVNQPLSKADLEKVMKWIAVHLTAAKAPYCWKESKPRTGTKPLSTCPEGTEKNGLLCYPECDEGYKGNGPVCWQIGCPDGFKDIGAFCQKPQAYGRGVGYVDWDLKKCNAENEQGCERNGAMWYPKCKEDFHAVGANICSPDCPDGMKDTGTGCAKKSYGRTAGKPMECEEGLEKSGALCYQPCEEGENGVGPVCWKQCPSHLPESCGAGCTADKKTCIDQTYSQIMSVAQAALALGSMGAGGKASGMIDSLDEMTGIVDTIKGMADESNGSVPAMLGKDRTFDVRTLTPLGANYTGEVKRVQDMILHYGGLFSDNFETLTTPEINEEIDSKFSEEAAEQIKKEFGMRHLALTLKMNGFKAAQDLLWMVSYGDPTGLAAVGEAFTHPICDPETPFPDVRELK